MSEKLVHLSDVIERVEDIDARTITFKNAKLIINNLTVGTTSGKIVVTQRLSTWHDEGHHEDLTEPKVTHEEVSIYLDVPNLPVNGR